MTKTALTTVKFSAPIEQAGQDITEVKLRKPKAGELRGTRLSLLVIADVASMMTLLPRITQPALAPETLDEMDVDDFFSLCQATMRFFDKAPVTATEAETESA